MICAVTVEVEPRPLRQVIVSVEMLFLATLQAEEILQNSRADLVAIGRALLKDPFWPRTAAE